MIIINIGTLFTTVNIGHILLIFSYNISTNRPGSFFLHFTVTSYGRFNLTITLYLLCWHQYRIWMHLEIWHVFLVVQHLLHWRTTPKILIRVDGSWFETLFYNHNITTTLKVCFAVIFSHSIANRSYWLFFITWINISILFLWILIPVRILTVREYADMLLNFFNFLLKHRNLFSLRLCRFNDFLEILI